MKAPVTQSGQAEARRPARERREEGVTHPSRKYSFLNESPTSCLRTGHADRGGKDRKVPLQCGYSTFLNESPAATQEVGGE